MDFDLEQDVAIFDQLLLRRPEIDREKLKGDLEKYYLPYTKKLIELKKQKSPNQGLLVGVSAIQGVGKTTQGEILEILLDHFGHSTNSQSIDDHYLTHRQLCELRQHDPRYIRRGVTHDINLAARDLKKLKTMTPGQPVLISGYDKGIQSGDGDRLRWVNMEQGLVLQAKVIEEELMVNKQFQSIKALQLISAHFQDQNLVLLDNMGSDIPVAEYFLPAKLVMFLGGQTAEFEVTQDVLGMVEFKGNGEVAVDKKDLPHAWRLVTKKPDFIFYDGWMLGARSVTDESVFASGLPALETPEDQQFARDVNKKLLDYENLWAMFDFLNLLYVVNYQDSLKWRDQAEEALRAKGEGMTHDQIVEFVHYFWRSVHPAIHIKNLAHDEIHTQQVVVINDDHSVGEILSPGDAKIKYS
jgi:pantothenate kinase-related protein Tda10